MLRQVTSVTKCNILIQEYLSPMFIVVTVRLFRGWHPQILAHFCFRTKHKFLCCPPDLPSFPISNHFIHVLMVLPCTGFIIIYCRVPQGWGLHQTARPPRHGPLSVHRGTSPIILVRHTRLYILTDLDLTKCIRTNKLLKLKRRGQHRTYFTKGYSI